MQRNPASLGSPGSGARSRRLFLLLDTLEKELEAEWSLTTPRGADGLDVEPGHRLVLLQRWLGLSDEDLLFEVDDRRSLRRFCGIGPAAPMPSSQALAAFRAHLEAEPEARDLVDRLTCTGRRMLYGSVPLISIVSPVYRAEAVVVELVRRIREETSALTEDFEIILVDDGSPDRSWSRIESCARKDARVRGVKLSRNFGQNAAITAGLAHSRGDWVVVMDCDLQDDPRYIPLLYETALEGADIVYTVKQKREHGVVKNFFGVLFSRCLNWLSTEDTADPRIGAYSLISRRVVDTFVQLEDVHRHYLVLLRWLGFSSTKVEIQHQPRFAGKSTYSFWALVRHAINGIVSHSDRLLYLSIGVGFSFLVLSLLGIAALVVAYFRFGFQEGWTSTMVLILLTTSMVLLSIGTVGIYIGKIFEQVKRRPLYLVEKVDDAAFARNRAAVEEG